MVTIDMPSTDGRPRSRRQLLQLLAVSGFSGLAGCGGSDPSTASPTAAPRDPTASDTSSTPTGTTKPIVEGPDLVVTETIVEPREVAALDPVHVRERIRNDGTAAGQFSATLLIDGTGLRSRTIQVPAGGEREIDFVFRAPSAGIYAVGTARASVDVTVTEPTRALPSFEAPASVLDTSNVPSRSDLLLFNTLQGVVNARRPRIFLEVGSDWERSLGVETRPLAFWDLIEAYRNEPTGVVVYDPRSPHSVNAATTVAGVERALVAAPLHVDRLETIGFDVLLDFRDPGIESADQLSLYRWLIDEYWERTADHVVVGLPPTRAGNPTWQFRDYAVAVKATTVWLDAARSDHAELLLDLTSRMPVPGAYLGWWPDEVSGVRLASGQGVFTGAADYMDSATYWSGTRPRAPASWPRFSEDVAVSEPDDSVYVTFTITEGDNLQYCQKRLKSIWDSEVRGRHPINWSISPMLADIAPALLAYYFETATENDHFMCGPTGVGYAYPKDWPASSLSAFTRLTGQYLDELDLELLYALNRLGIGSTLSSDTVAALEEDTDLVGVALGWAGPETTRRGERLIVSKGIGGLHAGTSAAEVASEIRASVPDDRRGESPLFRSVGLFGFEMGPAEVDTIVEELDEEFEVVRGDVFFELARQVVD